MKKPLRKLLALGIVFVFLISFDYLKPGTVQGQSGSELESTGSQTQCGITGEGQCGGVCPAGKVCCSVICPDGTVFCDCTTSDECNEDNLCEGSQSL